MTVCLRVLCFCTTKQTTCLLSVHRNFRRIKYKLKISNLYRSMYTHSHIYTYFCISPNIPQMKILRFELQPHYFNGSKLLEWIYCFRCFWILWLISRTPHNLLCSQEQIGKLWSYSVCIISS